MNITTKINNIISKTNEHISNIKHYQENTYPEWIADNGSGTPFAYDKFTAVKYTDGNIYYSLVDSNTEEPTTGSNWSQFPITPSSEPTTDYQVANKKYVDTKAPIESPALTGAPTAPTPTSEDNSTRIATTAFVSSALGGAWVANDSRAKTALNADGTAPIYACRAWVNFNGTGTVAIRASGNVSSIIDNGLGDYTVNFTTAMGDSNYSTVAYGYSTGINNILMSRTGVAPLTTSIRLAFYNVSSAGTDLDYINIAIFR